MKRKFALLSLLVVLAMCMFAFACNNNDEPPAPDSPVTLSAPVISLNGNVVSWTRVENAEGYQLNVDGQTIEQSGLMYTIPDDVTSCSIFVRAYLTKDGQKTYSDPSQTVTYTKTSDKHFSTEYDKGTTPLAAPKIGADGMMLYWPVIHYATGYRIYFNGEAHDEVETNFYWMDQSVKGNYNITVRAFSSYEEWAISPDSNAVAVEVTKEFTPVEVYAMDEPYNAKGDGKTNDRASIQAAIDYVYSQGGGTVILSGNRTYLLGSVFLRDNVTLKFEDGVKILQSPKAEDYASVNEKGEIGPSNVHYGTNLNDIVQFNHNWFYNYPIICAVPGSKNVSVIGKGTISFQPYGPEETNIRCVAVACASCYYVHYEDFTIDYYNAYGCGAYNCNYVLVKNITIKNPVGGCNDGVGVTNASYVRVTGCYIRSGDDSIDIGTGGDRTRGMSYALEKDLYPDYGVTNMEIDNNDTNPGGSDMKGLAFFTWGSDVREELSQCEISDIWVHDNKFATIGIWHSDSYDALYNCNHGIIPCKTIRFYDNEIGNVLGGFYYDGISDMNCFASMRNMINGDFERFKQGCWVMTGGAEVKTDNGNSYGLITLGQEESRLYQGLYLSGGEQYVLKAKAITSGATFKMFVADLDTGAIITTKEFNNTAEETVSMDVTIPKDGNYHVGFIGEAGTGYAQIDNVEFKTVYADDVYYEGGSSFDIEVENGGWSGWIQDYNTGITEESGLAAGVPMTAAMFIDIKEIKDPEGYITFSPLMQGSDGNGNVNTYAESSVIVKYKDFDIQQGRALLLFDMLVPENAQVGYGIALRWTFTSGISATFKKAAIFKASIDYQKINYEIGCHATVIAGGFAHIPEGVYFIAEGNIKIDSQAQENSNINSVQQLAGWTPAQLNQTVTKDDILAVGLVVEIARAGQFNLNFTPISQGLTSGDVTDGQTFTFKDLTPGKYVLVFKMSPPATWQASSGMTPRIVITGDVTLEWTRSVIAQETYDYEQNYTGYTVIENTLNEGAHGIPVEGMYFVKHGSITVDSSVYGQVMQHEPGFNPAANDADLNGGDIIVVTHLLNITQSGEFTIDFTPISQGLPTGDAVGGQKFTYKDLAPGLYGFSYKMKIPAGATAEGLWMNSRLVFEGNITAEWLGYIITDEEFDFKGYLEGYTVISQIVREGAHGIPVVGMYLHRQGSIAINDSVYGQVLQHEPGFNPAANGADLKGGDVIIVTHLLNITQSGEFTIDFTPISQGLPSGDAVGGQKFAYKDLTPGLYGFSYKMQLPAGATAEGLWMNPRLVFEGNITADWTGYIITVEDFDFEGYLEGYTIISQTIVGSAHGYKPDGVFTMGYSDYNLFTDAEPGHEFSGWIESGILSMVASTYGYKANQNIKVELYFTINSVTDLSGSIALVPKTWLNNAAGVEAYTCEYVGYSDAGLQVGTTGKYKFSFTAKLPANFAETDTYYPMIRFERGAVNLTLDGIVVSDPAKEVPALLEGYTTLFDRTITTGIFGGILNTQDFSIGIDVAQDAESGCLQCGHIQSSAYMIGVDQVIRVGVYIELTQDAGDFTLTFSPCTQVLDADDCWDGQAFEMTGLKAGKHLLVFTFKVPNGWKSLPTDGSSMTPRIFITQVGEGGVHGTWTKCVFTDAATSPAADGYTVHEYTLTDAGRYTVSQ